MIENMEDATNTNSNCASNEALFVFLRAFAKERKLLCISDKSAAVHRVADTATSVEWLIIDDASDAREMECLRVAPYTPGPLPFDDETFDLVIVPALFTLQTNADQSILELRRVVRGDGLVVLGIVNSDNRPFREISVLRNAEDGLSEQGLFRVINQQFAVVTLLGQTPLFGYSVVDFSAAGELSEISYDGSLIDVGAQVPEGLIALCSQDRVTIDPYTVVQVPAFSFRHTAPRTDIEGVVSDQEEQTVHTQEVERLEEALRTRGEELRELRAEMDRRDALERDLVEQIRSNADDTHRLTSERDRAIARAVEAEAERIETALRLDEVCGHLKVAGVSPEDVQTTLENNCASLSGRVRGMQSRIAELEESREMAEARLVLKEQDLELARETSRMLERNLEETRERFELELARTNRAESDQNTDQLVEENIALKEKCDELTARLSEAEKKAADSIEKNAAIELASNDLEDENAAFRDRVEALQRDNALLESRVSECEIEIEGERHKSSQAIAEKYQIESKLADLMKEIDGHRLKLQQLQERLDNSIDEKSRLTDELEASRTESESRSNAAEERINDLLEALRETRASLQELSQVVTSPEQNGSKSIGSQQVDVVEDLESRSNEG